MIHQSQILQWNMSETTESSIHVKKQRIIHLFGQQSGFRSEIMINKSEG